MPVALLTVALGLIALWIAFAALINPTGPSRTIFKIPGPMFAAAAKARTLDWSMRNALFEVLYQHWSNHAFKPMPLEDLTARMKARVGAGPSSRTSPTSSSSMRSRPWARASDPEAVRLSASGIDLYEQLILKKYDF